MQARWFLRERQRIAITYASQPPRALPSRPGLIFFHVDRGAQNEEWERVVERLFSMATRLNENLVVSNIQGQRTLSVKSGAQTATLQFTLYVVPQERA